MKVAVVASTRPEVIKLSPVLDALTKKDISYIFVTTGQHYDDLLFNKFLDDLGLEKPDYDIKVGSASPAVQTGKAMIGVEKILSKERPDVVVVEGDTNSVLATALAAVKQKIPVAHVEAGLRSHDRSMPEEINRILTDHASEILFPPTENSALNLVNEGISPKKIHVVGNTIVDAVHRNMDSAVATSKVLEDLPSDYFLLTLHRQENTDDLNRLKGILAALLAVNRDVVFPIHPRTSAILRGSELEKMLESEGIYVIPPVGYLDFLVLLKNAFAVLTDSGGLQEEAITLNVPCLTLRTNTERPETVKAGGNIVVGVRKEDIIQNIILLEDRAVYDKMKNALNPYGDGRAGERIVSILVEKHKNGELVITSSDTRKGYLKRNLIPVEPPLAGKTIRASGLEIMKVVVEGDNRFPYPDFVLEKGQFIEILKKD